MFNRLRYKIIILFLLYPIVAKTGYPALDVFTSSIHLSMAGAGYLHSSPVSAKNNPSLLFNKSFSASLIKYPASISAQSAGLQFPFKNGGGSVSLHNISYGTFQGYDEDAQFTGAYSSSDTWLRTSYRRKILLTPIYYGVSTSLYSSSYNAHKVRLVTFALGLHIKLSQHGTVLGISAHNFGKQFEGAKVDFLPQALFSISKKLTHLPLTIYSDLISYSKTKKLDFFIGSDFKINKNINIRAGSSTRKVSHNTNRGLMSSVLGASGIGFGYQNETIFIHYGIFMHGTTAFVQGLEIGTSI